MGTSDAERDGGFTVSRQRWRDVLFLHWQVPPEALRALVPRELELDTFEGRAYVGLVPFLMRDVRAPFLPAIPGLSDFHEVNLRTYVRSGAQTGVWFFSLDASSDAAVVAARAGFQLPYYRSRASHTREDGTIHYRSERQPPGPLPATLDVRYTPGAPIGTANPGTLEHFLVERYALFTNWRPVGVRVGRVRHAPYALQDVTLHSLDCDTLVGAHGLPSPSGEVHTLFSPGVDVRVHSLQEPGRA